MIVDQFRFSSPASGRPTVRWTHGSTQEIICEFWPEWDSPEQSVTRFVICDSPEKKWIIYNKNRPSRAVLLLDVDGSSSDLWPIRKISLEATAVFDWNGFARDGKRLFAEFCRIRLRGRPRRTGKPFWRLDNRRADDIWDDLIHVQNKLRAAKFTDTEINTYTIYLDEGKNKKQTAKRLGVSPSAINQRLKRMEERCKKRTGLSLARYVRRP